MEQPDATDRGRGTALIVSAVASLFIALAHPTGRDFANTADRPAVVLLSQIVHGLAIAAVVVSLLGSIGLWRRLAPAAPLAADLAAVAFALAGGCTVLAAVAGGFLAPDLLGRMAGGDAAATASATAAMLYNHLAQRVYAKIFTLATAAAIGLWSFAGWRHRRLPRWLAAYGLASAIAVTGLLVAGALVLDVHGLLVLMLAEAVWFVGAGTALCRPPSAIS